MRAIIQNWRADLTEYFEDYEMPPMGSGLNCTQHKLQYKDWFSSVIITEQVINGIVNVMVLNRQQPTLSTNHDPLNHGIFDLQGQYD